MCTQTQLSGILARVGETAKSVFGDKLAGAYLYGSYARGDQTDDSDVDIMIVANVPRASLIEYKRPFLELSSELGLENDMVITVTLKDAETFNRFSDDVPFYKNVITEGISLLSA